ncbi:MAG: peptidoglycan-binding protein [Candidatus Kaiserbacteria bacterium]|nr:MAG: peptidoglycan-binding protein [Candidatus Kaiserbacteria bacterium]
MRALQGAPAAQAAPAATSAPVINPISTAVGGCMQLSRTLLVGARGEDVAALQRFLARDSSIYSGEATGYFGALTQAAVQRFQAKYGIASGGSPQSNGYGAVGPRTRALIRTQTCLPGEAGSQPITINETTGVPTCAIIASRSEMRAGESVTVSWTSKNAAYAVDNTTGRSVGLEGSAIYVATTSTTYIYSFFGSRPGTPAVCSARVYVSAPIVNTLPVATESPTEDTLVALPTDGSSPLYVNFSFRPRTGTSCSLRSLSIEYGDGVSEMLTTNVCASTGTRTAFHAFRQNGTYGVRVWDNSSCSGNSKCERSIVVAGATIRVAGPSSCTVNGNVIAHGETREFYNVSVVLPGQSCVDKKVVRSCVDGVLSGETSYQFSSCTVAPTPSCTLDGITVPSGGTRTFYAATPNSDGTCASLSRSCSSGVLSGSGVYSKASCVGNGSSPLASCTLDGRTITHGSSTTFYFAQNVPSGEQCSSYGQTRTCSNGVLNGSTVYKYSSCTPVSSNSCALDNTVVTTGSSATFYKYRTPPAGELCDASKLTRTCTNGTLGGSNDYVYASCTNTTSCTQGGITLGHSSSSLFYSTSTVAFGSTCAGVSLERTCTNGKLSGADTYSYGSCSVRAPSASVQQSLANALTALERAIRGILDMLR